jgi:hypothetical protein
VGVLGFDFRGGLGIFLFTTASITALGTTQLPIQWLPGALSLGIKCPEFEADHSAPFSAEVKECMEHKSTPQYSKLHILMKHKRKGKDHSSLCMNRYWRRGDQAASILSPGSEWQASCSCRFIQEEGHCYVHWMGSSTCLDTAAVNRNVSASAGNWKPSSKRKALM